MSEHPHPENPADVAPVRPATPTAQPAPADIADGIEKKLDPRVITVWRIGYAIAAGFLFLGSLIGLLVFLFRAGDLPRWVFPLVGLAWVVFVMADVAWAVGWPGLRYRYEAYRVLADGMEIRRGVVWRTIVHVPRSRVQHTDVSRGPIERAFGLATLVIYTAGTEHASISLGGMSEATAVAIRNHLIPGGRDDAV